ncbi:MAG TPA: tautomerase family protein [Terriglobia bacterium]|nr:tautomerase family protein [Terriglobia bacterium]
MPHVIVKLWPGKTDEQKKQLADRITRAMKRGRKGRNPFLESDSVLVLLSRPRCADESADMAQRVFELSQSLTERWIASQHAAKRQILEMICLNFTLDGATLVPEMRKPFDVLIEGLCVSSSRGDKI